MKRIFLDFFLLILFFSLAVGEAGEVKITTYYPAPYGEYRQISVEKLGVGDNDDSGVIDAGDAPQNPGEVWIKESLGIRTNSPGDALDVQGGFFILGGNGDVTGDGNIVPLDVLRIVNYINGVSSLNSGEYARADINGDGRVDITDGELLTDVLNGNRTIAQAHQFGRQLVDRAMGVKLDGTIVFLNNVGIATKEPRPYTLHVNGSAYIGNQADNIDYTFTPTGADFGSLAQFDARDNIRTVTLGDWEEQNAAYFVTDYTNSKFYFMNGNVGIGTSTPGNILTIQQGSTTDPIADAWMTYSSFRWKTNIRPIGDALEKILRLRGVYFEWKKDGKHDIGMIAEEVGEVIPEVVQYEDNKRDAKSLDYGRLVAVLVEAVKAQQQEILELKKRLGEIEKRIGE